MDSVLRAAAIYLAIVVLFRLTGKRTLAQITTLDLVLLLIISEASQQALLGDDFSVTTAVIVITTLLAIDRTADYLRWRSRTANRLLEGEPVVLVHDGKPLPDILRRERLNPEDILMEARQKHGLMRMDQIRYAILETSGAISVVSTDD